MDSEEWRKGGKAALPTRALSQVVVAAMAGSAHMTQPAALN